MAYKPSSKYMYVVGTSSMGASSKGIKRLQLWQFFSVDEGREDPNTFFQWAFIGPPAKRHLNGVMSFRWRVDHGCWNSLISSFIYVIVSPCIWR